LQASPRTAPGSGSLVRLLARLVDAEPHDSRVSLTDRLSQWLGWTDALTLATALNGTLPALPTQAARAGVHASDAEHCAQLRSSLANAIADDRALATTAGAGTQADDYLVFRQRYLSLQQAMENAVTDLRARLRSRLAAMPGMIRLALVDAAMERALAPRERQLLGHLPVLLRIRFEALRGAEQARMIAAAQGAGDAAAESAPYWLETFRADMRGVLLAELEVRFQPVEGLLAALRSAY
jgi:hypothetical protein